MRRVSDSWNLDVLPRPMALKKQGQLVTPEGFHVDKRRAYFASSLPFLIVPFAVFVPLQYFGALELAGLPAFQNTFVYVLSTFVWIADVIRNWQNSARSIYQGIGPWVLAGCYCTAFIALYAAMVIFDKM